MTTKDSTNTSSPEVVEVLPYWVNHYNSLPTPNRAARTLATLDRAKLLVTIGRVFLKHHVQDSFGLVLLHKHFDLDEDDHEYCLVAAGPITTPWTDIDPSQEHVTASAWQLVPDGGLAPYEFVHDTKPRPNICEFGTFIADLRRVLETEGLCHMFGICSFGHEDRDMPPSIEFTQARAVVRLPIYLHSRRKGDLIFDKVWQFEAVPDQSVLWSSSSSETENGGTGEEGRAAVVGPSPIVRKRYKVPRR